MTDPAGARLFRVRRPGATAIAGCFVVLALIAAGVSMVWMFETSRARYEAANTATDLQGNLADLGSANGDLTQPGTIGSDADKRSVDIQGRIAAQLSALKLAGFEAAHVDPFAARVDQFLSESMRERVLVLLGRRADALARAEANDARSHALVEEAHNVVVELRGEAASSSLDVQHGILALGVVLLVLVAGFLVWDGRRRRRAVQIEAETTTRARFEAMVEHSSDLVVLTSPAGEVTYVSPSLTNVLGYDHSDRESTGIVGLVHPDDAAVLTRLYQAATANGHGGPTGCRIRHANGDWRTMEMVVVDLTDVPAVGAMLWTARDVTERELAHASLRDSETRLAEAQRLAQLGSWSYDVDTGGLSCSAELYRVIGVDPAVGIAKFDRFMLLVHPDDHVRAAAFLRRVQEDFTAFADELRIVTPGGVGRWLALRAEPVADAQGSVVEMRGTLQDITERKVSESQLVHLALHDMLTGLPNRSLFNDRLDRVLADKSTPAAVLLLDVDGFKTINDSAGHSAGDAFLVEFANRLTATVRPSDMVARLGGDEFTVLVEGADEAEAVAMAERILRVLRDPFALDGTTIEGKASIGISLGLSGAVGDEVLRDADAAMYAAKRKGGNRFEVFSPDLHAELIERRALECDLRTVALGTDMTLHYQPIVDLRSGRLTGFEALLRWMHPERGPLSPADFIPIAEETGAIIRIGRWVVDEACRQVRVWQLRYPEFARLSMNVNVSAKQLTDRDIVGDVAQALAMSGLDPSLLTLELTETMIMADEDDVGACVQRLKDLGVRISVDDFGTGYSSLGHLDRFPVDELKIDRSFVAPLGDLRSEGTVAMAVIRLARSLHIEVVAEGVENREQLVQLCAAACTRGQGWYFWRALAPGDAEELLGRSARAILPPPAARSLLVVDDDDGVRKTTCRILVRAGFRVIEARTCREAIERATANRFDGVVLDMHLPDGDGIATCQQLKSIYDGELAVVHLSGMAISVDDRVRGLDAGADGYLIKPVEPTDLVATIESALRARRIDEPVG